MEILGVMFSQGELWILSLLSLPITALLSYRIGLNQAAVGRRAAAAATFRIALNRAKENLPPIDQHWTAGGLHYLVEPLLKSVRPAINDFHPYLTKKAGNALLRTFGKLEMHCGTQMNSLKWAIEYHGAVGSPLTGCVTPSNDCLI
ncbi:hypothetical protein [Polaromonas sp. UC242_47]|uniref:hypothetical protein n=1 Tax=Polaromonas sp. UC242_47 TaxID=3374626 RepID=UPI0037B58125